MSTVAVIGGGWAGMAAAVTLVQAGAQVSVFESARHWGGRARALSITGPQGQDWLVDNGQHILIGAYTQCLELMNTVGVNTASALLRQPLDLRDIHGQGLHLPDLPPPFDAALGIARTRGWRLSDKLALLLRANRWQQQGFRCGPHESVADLCAGLPERLLRDFVEPLCISALNLPMEHASGSLFLRVLRDSLFAGRGGSNFLLPRVDMGALFPDAAARWLEQQGATLHLGRRVQRLQANASGQSGWLVDGQAFDAVLLATHSHEAARLALQAAGNRTPHASACRNWAKGAAALEHTAIATVYAWAPPSPQGTLLPTPMVALPCSAQEPAQFAFDKGRLNGPAGLLALVVSACTLPRQALQERVLAQARQQLQLPRLQGLKTVIDKRATFACTPAVQRPPAAIAPDLWACGDYVQGPYPATLEGAVRCARTVAQATLQECARISGSPDTTG